AAADAMPHNPSQESAPAPARKGASPSDDTAQWRADTDHVDIPENGLEDDSAKMQRSTAGRLASPDPDNLLAEATRQIAEASRRKVFSEAPKFGRADETRPPKPRSTLESEPVAPRPTGHIDLPDAEYAQASGEPEDKQPQASRNAFIAAARKAAQRNQVEASESRSLIGRAFSRLNARAHSAPERVDEPEPEPIEPVSSTMKTEVAVPLEETDPDAPERAEDDTVDPVIAEEDEPDRESFLSRNRRPILLAATLAAAGMLTLNLVGQRIAQHPATAPQAAKTSETEALPAPIRQVGGQRTSSLDSIRTGSINAVTGAAPTSIDQNVLPTDPTRMQAIDPFGANAPATEIRPASVVAPATGTANLATPVTAPSMPEAKAPAIELPPAQIGPIALRQAAASGDARAQFEIGAIYTEGQVVARDYVLASQWYERAAKQGFAPAQYRLGSLYEHGDGVDKDLAKASHWYELAAEAGNRMAMHNLAALDASGAVGKQDFGAAAKWFEKAAQQGLKDSQFNLGMLYARGLGVPQNLIQSYKWFAIAAETGDKDAAKARDDVARSLDADKMNQAQAEVAAWKPAAIDIKANFAPIGTWSKDFDPGKTIATKEVVQRVQEALGRLGFDAGTADGMMGPKTTEAIRQFEAATGMSESGAVNPRLLAVLGSQPV
ncbi:MAG TPA: SEL1-like repeat protein, partial [Devosiaceae bacterium]